MTSARHISGKRGGGVTTESINQKRIKAVTKATNVTARPLLQC